MIRRILGAVATLVGALLVYAHFAVIADPAPGVRWNVWQLYGNLIIGVPLLVVGLYKSTEASTRRPGRLRSRLQPPNMRLKLPGGDRFKGSGVLCAGAHELSFNCTALGERVARSLSAIR